MKKILISIVLLSLTTTIFPQSSIKQTIRGTVVDKYSQMPLIGATIVLLNSNPQVGTVADVNGEFRIENVPVGRCGIQISYIGYNPVTLKNLMLYSGKELIINIELEEKIIETAEVVVKAYSRKDKPINKMATVSARSFTVEETNKYAGSWGDPSRMVANYAGVCMASDNRNDIIIRGNSPIGLLWRLDGIEIPNPNHFGALGTTGGPVTILNNNLLTNSDFFTGAFPAEYGNALAGAFDLKMRAGNNEKREYWGQMGFNGIELGGEGPFSKNSKASYMLSYRYSMLDALKAIGLDMGINPKYQDLTFKVNIPGTKLGKFSLFGIGGLSYIEMFDSENDSIDWAHSTSGENLSNGSDFGAIGLSNLYFINNKTRIQTNLAILGSRVSTEIDTFHFSNRTLFPWYREVSSEVKYSFSTHLKKKLNTKNNIGTGLILDRYKVNYLDSVYLDKKYLTITDVDDYMNIVRLYGQWQHKFSDKLQLYSGIHYQLLQYNNTSAIEPRLGLKWNFATNQSFNFGFGVHSQIQPRMIYFAQSLMDDGTYKRHNKDLGFSKSNHYVIGYDNSLSENFRIKIETYYQDLYNIPIKINDEDSIYSLMNSGADFYVQREDSLINKGTGKNYGIELTIEKFFSNQYYFLITTSLFESKYKIYEKERNTAFNGNFVINVLGGYEINVGNNNILSFDIKTIYAGGKRYIPFDTLQSRIEQQEIYDLTKAYEKKYPDYFRFDFRVSFKLNTPKLSQEWVLDLQNISNNENLFMERYDYTTGKTKSMYQIGFFPMMTWRIQF
ncbi:MAG: TonB-dependent receptor [Bacteroidales bacterium]|nr:TonB-dependent receptor [Bacteroidales bacterium]